MTESSFVSTLPEMLSNPLPHRSNEETFSDSDALDLWNAVQLLQATVNQLNSSVAELKTKLVLKGVLLP